MEPLIFDPNVEFVEVDIIIENVEHDKMIHCDLMLFDIDTWWVRFLFNFFLKPFTLNLKSEYDETVYLFTFDCNHLTFII